MLTLVNCLQIRKIHRKIDGFVRELESKIIHGYNNRWLDVRSHIILKSHNIEEIEL